MFCALLWRPMERCAPLAAAAASARCFSSPPPPPSAAADVSTGDGLDHIFGAAEPSAVPSRASWGTFGDGRLLVGGGRASLRGIRSCGGGCDSAAGGQVGDETADRESTACRVGEGGQSGVSSPSPPQGAERRQMQRHRVMSMGVYGQFGNRVLHEHPVAEGAEDQWGAFLQEGLGLSGMEAGQVLALCPHLVGSLPTESAKQTVAFLSGRGGFTRRQLHDAIIKNPWLLCPGVDKELPALVAVLQKEVGMSGERALFLMRQYPRLMQHGTTFTASHTLGWLRGELGLSRQEAQAAVTSTPQLLSCKASESGWQLMTLLSTELGLDKSSTKQVVMAAPRLLLPRGAEMAAEAVGYLKYELRLEGKALCRVVVTKPRVMAHAPGDYLAKVVDYLEEELGMPREDVRQLFAKNPAFLDMNLPHKNRTALPFLQGNLELSLEQVRRMVGLYPVLLRYPGSSLQTTAEWLTRSLECNKKDVAHIALKSPQVFGHSLEMKMQKILNFLLKELGCNISEARAIVLSQPHVFSYSREKNLLPKVEYFGSLGLSSRAVIRLLTECPQVVGAGLLTIQEKVDYLRHKWGLDCLQVLEEYPLYLSYSLDRRIRPRHIYALRSLSTRVATPSPAMLLAPSDAQFALLVGGTLQSYRRWLKEAEADLQRPSNSSRRLQADAAGREDIKMAGTDD